MAAVGRFVLWGKENLCLVRALDGALALETLYYAEDIRSRAEITEAVEETDVTAAELTMARQLVESLVGSFDPSEHRNSYRDELRAMLDAKIAGHEIVTPEPVPEAPVIDLMEALRQSVAAAAEQKPPARKRRAKTA